MERHAAQAPALRERHLNFSHFFMYAFRNFHFSIKKGRHLAAALIILRGPPFTSISDDLKVAVFSSINMSMVVEKVKKVAKSIYSSIENLVLWAMSEISGFAVMECHGVLE